ncbi:MAG: metallophosphoesterase [Tannerella sp.]|jgi:Icc-related predicted phosphoesterase|nr:metallophosphoesterase [Tannerella sp.]
MKKNHYTIRRMMFIILPLAIVGLIAWAQDYYRLYTETEKSVLIPGNAIDSVKVEGSSLKFYEGNAASYTQALSGMDSLTFESTPAIAVTKWTVAEPGNLEWYKWGSNNTVGTPATGVPATVAGPGGLQAWALAKADHIRLSNPFGASSTAYTLLWDIKVPSLSGYCALLQTNQNNSNDGDVFLNNTKLGVGAYSPDGTLTANKWHRIVISVDAGETRQVVFYVDGRPVLFKSLSSSADITRYILEDIFWIFLDNDNEDYALDCAGIAVWNANLSAEQVSTLGVAGSSIHAFAEQAKYVRIGDESQLTHHLKGETNTSVYVTVSHNMPYEAASDQAWCTLERFDSEAKHQLKIAAGKNETGETRTAKITITGGAEPVVVTLTQDAASHQTGFPRFAVLSDTHFDNTYGGGESSSVKVPRALENLTLNNGQLDAIFNVGDLTDHGQIAEYDHLMETFTNAQYVPQYVPVYYLMGNHDNQPGNVSEFNYLSKTRQPMNQYLEIKGYPFITISQTGTNALDYNHAAQRFLRESLADAQTNYPGKPIFVFVHVPPRNTCYGSGDADGWGSTVFPPLLELYPQVIVFAGHSHFPLGDPRSIWQDKYTSVNDGSTNYSEVEPNIVADGIHPKDYNKVTEGLIVNLKDGGNTVEMERWDTRRNVEILPRWAVHAPYDGSNFSSEYKGRNGAPPPAFAAGDSERIAITAQGTGRWQITFPQATDNEVVHHYIINVRDASSNAVVQTQKRFSLYYLNSDMPASLTVEFSGLPTDRQLKVEIIAVDAYYDKQSEPISKLLQ